MFDWKSFLADIGIAVTLISVVFNIIQFMRARVERKSLRELVQSTYNSFYLVARCSTRMRRADDNHDDGNGFVLSTDIGNIAGVADAARINLIAFGREHLSFTPFFEHPAFPGLDQPDAVKLGLPPEEASGAAKAQGATALGE